MLVRVVDPGTVGEGTEGAAVVTVRTREAARRAGGLGAAHLPWLHGATKDINTLVASIKYKSALVTHTSNKHLNRHIE